MYELYLECGATLFRVELVPNMFVCLNVFLLKVFFGAALTPKY